VEAVGAIAGCYRSPRNADEVIEAVGLAEERDVRCVKLSGGQRRRLDVALGMVGDPQLLFLDEPTTGFDPEARRQFWGLIGDLRASGVTILLTTHYLDEAEHLADRVGVIIGGRMIEVGAPGDIGGRRHALAEVRWRDFGGEHREATETPTAVVRELASRFDGGGARPGGRPAHVGRHLRQDGRGALRCAAVVRGRGVGMMIDVTSSALNRGAPPLVTASLHRFTVEFREFWRTREGVFFTVLFPPVMLVLFGSIFGTGDVGSPARG
jgi:hypothetical protein